MAVRRFARGGRTASQLRSKKEWAGFSSGTGVTTLAAATSVIVGSFVVTAGPETILRTRGLLSIKSDQESADEAVHGALGIAIVSEDAFTVGITAVSTPISDIQNDSWFVWIPFHHAIQIVTAVGYSEPAASLFPIDSKAMRKFHSDQRAVVVLQNNAAAAGLNFHLVLRSLAKVGMM